MKQITLEKHIYDASGGPCVGRLLLVWGLFGYAMVLLWQVARGNPLAEIAAWAVGLAAAFGLYLGCWRR
jgi:hypothetical protein